MLRLSVFACVAATAASLAVFRPIIGRGSSVPRRPPSQAFSRGQRSTNPLAQLAPGAGAPLRSTAEWVSQVDEQSGQTYYCNSVTGECQWEPPMDGGGADPNKWSIDCLSGVAGFSGVPGFAASNKFGGSLHEENNYRLELGREGRPCQLPYNLGPGEERRLSRYNMVDQKDTVAEVQCKVQCAADGTPIVVSMGDSATLWRSAGGAWNPLYKGQEQVLSAGDQLSLDANDPEAAVFVCNAPGGAGQAVGSTGGLPAGWVAQVDEASGVTYYSNTDTGECQWEVPQ